MSIFLFYLYRVKKINYYANMNLGANEEDDDH